MFRKVEEGGCQIQMRKLANRPGQLLPAKALQGLLR
jgi:hypothetical protein